MAEEPKDRQIVPLKLPHGTVRSRDNGYINILDLERLLREEPKEKKS